ncbi:tripartite tricarboxylate transporter substrate binding protein [Acuticoccus sp. M5D2P5]|uniref:Bug family tripartite tricarboxylate transporter substrate binding protein n=1 Tax=Acuticoccus kalidii TaxID=2910977 RepID=UPI001F2F8744|nr:tripartite tricarboxylate transporter substrate binding protein [Acuticoccus kalidii]MCF3936156.1 tripartite tricarboxylate transporter substrate binding protein [Acuticoccus kalidii]
MTGDETLQRKTTFAAILIAAASFGTASAQAQEFPCDSVEWIVGWGAGGGSDTFARSIAPGVSDALGVPVTVINMPGASSIVAMEEVLGRDADGCTLFSITPDQLTNELTGLTELSYRDLDAVMRAHVDIGMMYGAGDGLQSWDDVTSASEDVLVGGTGAASFDEIVVQIVMDDAGVPYRYIPYENASDMHADLIGGRLHLIYDEVSVMNPMIEAGQVTPLLALADERLEAFPDVPAAGELDYTVPPSLWRGVSVAGDAPEDVVAMLEAAFLKAAETEAYTEFEEGRMLNLYPGTLGAADFTSLLDREFEAYRAVTESK